MTVFLRTLFLGLAYFAAFQPLPVRACDCGDMSDEESLAITKAVELAFEGRVVMLEDREQPKENFDYTAYKTIVDNPLYSRARLRILDMYKGTPDGDRVEAFIDTGTDCGTVLQTGDVADFFLVRRDGVLMQAGLCDLPRQTEWEALKSGQFLTLPPEDPAGSPAE